MKGRGATYVACAVFVFANAAFAQPFRKEVYSVPISAQGAPIDHPLSGGFYNPSHQFVNIDGDDDLDLFLYDFNDGSVQMYRNIGTRQAPQLRWERPLFTLPPLRGWFRFADVNGDAKVDLLTGGDENSVTVYVNTGTASSPQFTLLTAGLRDSANNLVYSQIQCIPALADMDGDGDLDFFSLNPGLGTINYYENIGNAGSLSLGFRTARWQNIQICPGCGSPTNVNHGQGTMFFADVDGDMDYDMFYGDLFDPGIFFYRNIGTPIGAVMDSVSGHFPAVDPILTNGFNQPTLVDIDGDNDLDLFVSVLPPFQQVHAFWFYRNVGSPTAYNFSLVSRDYLSTFDAGIQSTPTLTDIDADGDLDLFVGDLFGHVGFLRNDGSTLSPSFAYVDTFFVAFTAHLGYAPAFADIDGDADKDMFLGHFDGNVEFHRNTGSPSTPAFQRELSAFDSLNVGSQSFAAPAFFDIDGDGDLDLFIGKQDGRISFFRNNGTAQNWQFTLQTTSFANVAVGFNAHPAFADVDNDGDRDLIVGASDGRLALYRNDGPPGNPAFTLMTVAFAGIDTAAEASPALADIDNDGDQDLIVGNLKGGLEFYRNDLITSVEDERERILPDRAALLQNYPNPFNPSTIVSFRLSIVNWVTIKVYDILGREVATLVNEVKQPGIYTVTWDGTGTSGLRAGGGVYFCRMTAGAYEETRRMILIK